MHAASLAFLQHSLGLLALMAAEPDPAASRKRLIALLGICLGAFVAVVVIAMGLMVVRRRARLRALAEDTRQRRAAADAWATAAVRMETPTVEELEAQSKMRRGMPPPSAGQKPGAEGSDDEPEADPNDETDFGGQPPPPRKPRR